MYIDTNGCENSFHEIVRNDAGQWELRCDGTLCEDAEWDLGELE